MTDARRRADDRHWTCTLALRASQFWEFIDRRKIDKHAVSLAILYGTIDVMRWAMSFASSFTGMPGLEKAAIIGAVVAPYMALQGAAIKWYFEARA